MAITKIKAIHKDLNYCLGYAIDPQKTDPLKFFYDHVSGKEHEHGQLYATGINCNVDTAFKEMMDTKRRYSKEGRRVLGYHIMQSFKPGEVDPDTAHKIGCEFAQRYLGDKYEAVVSTHLDRGHLHCHIMFNSVSFEDGMMYKNRFADYYGGIRKISDELCREHNLSVIDNPQGKGKHRLEWEAEKKGEPTKRSILKNDIDDIISKSFTFKTFIGQLEKRGYKVKHGEKVKHMAVKPPGGDRYIRLMSIGEDYTEDAIKKRLQDIQHKTPGAKKWAATNNQSYRYVGVFADVRKKKLRGFMALYWRYMYMFGKVKSGTATKKQTRHMSPELSKFKQYLTQHTFVQRNNIESDKDLKKYSEKLSVRIDELTARRTFLYGERRKSDNETEREALSGEIKKIRPILAECRREQRLCEKIREAAPAIEKQLQKTEATKKVSKERDKNGRSTKIR